MFHFHRFKEFSRYENSQCISILNLKQLFDRDLWQSMLMETVERWWLLTGDLCPVLWQLSHSHRERGSALCHPINITVIVISELLISRTKGLRSWGNYYIFLTRQWCFTPNDFINVCWSIWFQCVGQLMRWCRCCCCLYIHP